MNSRAVEQPAQSKPVPASAITADAGLAEDLARAEAILRKLPPRHDCYTCRMCKQPDHLTAESARPAVPASAPKPLHDETETRAHIRDTARWAEDRYRLHRTQSMPAEQLPSELPPQTVVARALSELEEDFYQHKKCVCGQLSVA